MAIAAVQSGDTGASQITSGTAFSLGSNPKVGSHVLMYVYTAAGTTTVTSTFGGTWVKQGSVTNADGFMDFWDILVTSTGSSSITVTSVSANAYASQYVEWSGVGSFVSLLSQSGTSTTPNPSFTTPVVGQLLTCSIMAATSGGTGVPGAPWTAWNQDIWVPANKVGTAYQVTTSSSTQTATWTGFTSTAWNAVGGVYSPTLYKSLVVTQAVQRAATR